MTVKIVTLPLSEGEGEEGRKEDEGISDGTSKDRDFELTATMSRLIESLLVSELCTKLFKTQLSLIMLVLYNYVHFTCMYMYLLYQK